MLKKKLAVLCAAVMMVACLGVVVGCGPSNEQIIRDGLTQELDLLKNKDADLLADLSMGSDVDVLAEYGVSSTDFMNAYLDGFDYRIGDVKVDGDTAQVTVTLTCKDFAEYQKALENAGAQLAADDSLAGLDDAGVNQKLGEVVMSSIAGIQPVEKEPVVIDCQLVNGTWEPSDDSMNKLALALFA